MTGVSEASGAADAALPGKSDAEGWRRLHPLSPLLRGGVVLFVVLGIIVANFRDRFVELFFGDRLMSREVEVDLSDSGSMSVDAGGDVVDLFVFLSEEGLILIVLAALIAVILLIILFFWISWRFTSYRITDEAVETRGGVLFRTHRRAPLERIQSVNLQRSLLARICGLTKIQVLTAGQGGKVELAFLGHGDAKVVREQIVVRAAMKRGETTMPDSARPDPAATGLDAPSPAVGLDGRFLSPGADRLTAHVNGFIDADVDPDAVEQNTLLRVPAGRLIASILLGWDTIFMVALMVAAVLAAIFFEPMIAFAIIPLGIAGVSVIFSQFNKGFNFTLSRGRDAVRTGSGLTSTVTETLPLGRIHAVEARQPLLWRPLGWWRARITTAGYSIAQAGQSSTQNVVLPVGSASDVLRVLETLLPGIGDEEHEIAGLRDGLTGRGAEFVGAGRRSFGVLLWGRRRAGVRIADAEQPTATLQVRRGVLTRSLSVMPIVRAQSVQLGRPLMHRMLGLATVQAHTVLGPVRMQMRGLGLAEARAFFDTLAATVLRVQGADAAARARGADA